MRSVLKSLLIDPNLLQQKNHTDPPTIVRLTPNDNGSFQNSSACINSVQDTWTIEISIECIRRENPEIKIPKLIKASEKINTLLEVLENSVIKEAF